MKSLMCSIRKA